MIDDDFLATFFNLFNFLIVGQILSVIRLLSGEFYFKDEYGTLSGIQKEFV